MAMIMTWPWAQPLMSSSATGILVAPLPAWSAGPSHMANPREETWGHESSDQQMPSTVPCIPGVRLRVSRKQGLRSTY